MDSLRKKIKKNGQIPLGRPAVQENGRIALNGMGILHIACASRDSVNILPKRSCFMTIPIFPGLFFTKF
jgi:hypothetical protein